MPTPCAEHIFSGIKMDELVRMIILLDTARRGAARDVDEESQ
jgi:hypothetical protein